MSALFTYILIVVSVLTHLVAPDLFLQTDTVSPTVPAVQAASTPVAPPSQQQYTENYPITINPAATMTPVPAGPTAPQEQTGAAPAEIFGEAKVTDNFERGSSGFGLSAGLNEDDDIRIIALNNKLSLEPKKSNGWVNWRLRPPVINEGAVEMEFSIITCARGDRTGLMMRAKDYSSGNGYYFSLSCEGTISILRDSMVLGTADARTVFKNNSGDINVMGAVVQGNTLTAFLNGEKLLTVRDDAYPEGFCGFFTAPQGEKTLTMDVLSFKEYYRGE